MAFHILDRNHDTEPMSNSSMNDRWIAASLVERIIYGHDATFQADDALSLLALLPAKTWLDRLRDRLPAFSLKVSLPGSEVRGAAAGGKGTVNGRSGDRTYDYDSQGRQTLRAGQWKLYRTDDLLGQGTTVEVARVLSDLHEEDSASIRFMAGRPVAMTQTVIRSMRLFPGAPFVVSVSRQAPWKQPV